MLYGKEIDIQIIRISDGATAIRFCFELVGEIDQLSCDLEFRLGFYLFEQFSEKNIRLHFFLQNSVFSKLDKILWKKLKKKKF